MKKLAISLAAALTLAALATQPARAALVMDLTGGGTPTACGSCGAAGETFGGSFTVINAITIDGLGVPQEIYQIRYTPAGAHCV